MSAKTATKRRPRAATANKVDQAQAERMYKSMLFYRRFEEQVHRAYTKGKFAGFCHLHIGQEAVCVGVQETLRQSDYVISGYRSHTQAIAKGIEPGAVMAELFGKKTGTVMGKGGSMHMFSNELRFLGGHGIVGGQVPLAVGAAFAIRYRDEDDVCVCYLGDAATNQGQFFEAMNMAATWDLPVLIIIENNRYGMGTDIKRTTSIDRLCQRADAFSMANSDVDGMNVLAVHDHVKGIVEDMRKTKKPHLLEALTYRYRGHSVSDPATYRTKEEVKSYQEKDPILQLAAHMEKEGWTDEAQLKEWDKEARQKAKDAEAFADQSEEPEIALAYEHNYV